MTVNESLPTNPPDYSKQKDLRNALVQQPNDPRENYRKYLTPLRGKPEMFGKLGKNTMSPDIHNPHGITRLGHSAAKSE